MSDFSRAIFEALAAVKSGEGDAVATATARAMRLLSEALRADLHAGDCVLSREGARHIWRHPEGIEVTIAPYGALGFAAQIRHELGTLSGGFAFLDDADNDLLRALLR